MLGDSITLADSVPANHVYTKIGDDKVSSDFANQSAAAGSTDKLTVRQSIDKVGKRRSVVRIDSKVAASESIPNPTQTSVYVVFEYNVNEVNTVTTMANLTTEMKNFLASTDAAKVYRGEV